MRLWSLLCVWNNVRAVLKIAAFFNGVFDAIFRAVSRFYLWILFFVFRLVKMWIMLEIGFKKVEKPCEIYYIVENIWKILWNFWNSCDLVIHIFLW